MPSLLRISASLLPENRATPILDRRKVRETIARLADIFAKNEPVYLAFSGGKDSAVLLHLCEPYRGRFELLWTNTGLQFAHVERFIREAGERHGLVELPSNVAADWQENGLPAEILAVANALDHVKPKVQAWVGCCARNIAGPIHAYMLAKKGRSTLIHGQRLEDKAPGLGMSSMAVPDHISVAAPLADWTTEDIMDFVDSEGVSLPQHYGEGIIDSLDCAVCPAQLALPHGPRLVDFMRVNYPAELQMALTGARKTLAAVETATAKLSRSIERGAAGERPETAFVRQRTEGVGDCMIAAFATAAGLTYEESAAAFGFPCSPKTGLPSLPPMRGINITEATMPLLRMGIPFASTMTKEGDPDSPAVLPSSDELKAVLPGKNAVLIVHVDGEGHALAWKDGRVVDGRADDPFHHHIDDLTLMGAVILTKGTDQ